MIAQDFTVSAIHGDQPPEERKLIMKVVGFLSCTNLIDCVSRNSEQDHLEF